MNLQEKTNLFLKLLKAQDIKAIEILGQNLDLQRWFRGEKISDITPATGSDICSYLWLIITLKEPSILKDFLNDHHDIFNIISKTYQMQAEALSQLLLHLATHFPQMRAPVQNSLKLMHQIEPSEEHPKLLITILKNALKKVTEIANERKAETQTVSSVESTPPMSNPGLNKQTVGYFESFFPATTQEKRAKNSVAANRLWNNTPALKSWYRGEPVLLDGTSSRLTPKKSMQVLFEILYLNLPNIVFNIVQNNQALIQELNLPNNWYYLLQILKKTVYIDQSLCQHFINLTTDISTLNLFQSFLNESQIDEKLEQLITKRIIILQTYSNSLTMHDISPLDLSHPKIFSISNTQIPQTYFFASKDTNIGNDNETLDKKELEGSSERDIAFPEPFLDLTTLQS